MCGVKELRTGNITCMGRVDGLIVNEILYICIRIRTYSVCVDTTMMVYNFFFLRWNTADE